MKNNFIFSGQFFLSVAWKRKFNLLKLTIVIALVSFVLNLKGISQDPVATFYSPLTRIWELLCGSLLALCTLYKKNSWCFHKRKAETFLTTVLFRNKRQAYDEILSNILSFSGCLILVNGFWRITKDVRYPGLSAVVPVLGSVLIIIAGDKAWINRKVLSNKIVVWCGLISFPLYLWHWPILSLARIVAGETLETPIRIAAVFFSILFASCTYHLLELPIRFGKWDKNIIKVLLLLTVVVGVAGYSAYITDGLKFRKIAKFDEINSSAFSGHNIIQLKKNCKKILGKYHRGHCLSSDGITDFSKFDLYLLGDSHGRSLSFGFDDTTIKYISIGRAGCLPLVGVNYVFHNFMRNCQLTYNKAFDFFRMSKTRKPLVVLVGRFSYYVEESGYGRVDIEQRPLAPHHIELLSGDGDQKTLRGSEAFKMGLIKTFDLLSNSFEKVVVVLQVPELGFDPKSCIFRPFKLTNDQCYLSKEAVLVRQKRYRSILADVALNFPRVRVYDPLDLFCDNTKCYALQNGIKLYDDDDHVSLAGARVIWADMQSKGFLP